MREDGAPVMFALGDKWVAVTSWYGPPTCCRPAEWIVAIDRKYWGMQLFVASFTLKAC